MIFSNTLVALVFALSASAMTSPHMARNVHQHRGLAARVAHSDVAQPEFTAVTPKKRANSPRCKAASSSAAPSSTIASSSVHTSAAPSTSAAPVNVAPAPPTFASSSKEEAPETTSSAAPPPPKTTSTPPPAPKTTSTPPPAPKTTSTPAPAPKTSEAAAPASGGFLAGTQSGDGTFYATGLGACGIVNTDADMIAAISHQVFDSYPGATANPNENPICGKKVTAKYQGKSVTVAITDRCGGCLGATDLDFAPSAFDVLADPALGRIAIDWAWEE